MAVTYVKATVESEKLRRLELREKIIRHWVSFPTKIDKLLSLWLGGGAESTIRGGPNSTLGGPRATPKVYKLTPMLITPNYFSTFIYLSNDL